MTVWGSSFRSCESLLQRLEENDPTLKELTVLSTKSFGDAEVARLVSVLESRSNTHWKSLSASGHAVSNESLFRLGQAIGGQTVMTTLAIGHSEMGDEGVVALCDGLAAAGIQNNPIVDIDLSYKGIRRKGLMRILETFGVSQHLQRLNLSRNPSICVCRLRLREELPPDSSFLRIVKEMDLSDCNVDNEFVEDMLTFTRPEHSMSLRLDNNVNVTMLTAANNISHIEKLYLSGCRIGDDAMQKLHAMDSWCMRGLQVLDLSKNELTSVGALALASLLGTSSADNLKLPSLVELNLSGNKLDEEGVLSILSALKTRDANMLSLDLSETDCGAMAAVTATLECPTASLRLFGNRLGSDGFMLLADRMKKGSNAALVSLDLAGNDAGGDAVIKVLKSLMNGIPSLTTLIIGGNENNQDVEAAIKLVKEQNPHVDIARDKLQQPKVEHNT
ncbi:hypothetical protein MPSEU_001013200 [Mayamaea pseudoterrestris]|nr:hypothetical protein MPSEU_001013200 [Mayamaea pseudoterrestris]